MNEPAADPVGMSIIICCHNSATRIGATLEHLAGQEAPAGVPWEVIVVDNASTDQTGEEALAVWRRCGEPAPLRIVAEPQPGVAYARVRGLESTRYALVSFVDDDNWVDKHWVREVVRVMAEHPEAGACGGLCLAVPEITPPPWFAHVHGSYGVHGASPLTGYVPKLWGAGLTVRRSAWGELARRGFRHRLSGRRGRQLRAGEDGELTLALRLAGWQLWFDESLRLHHWIPGKRLTRRYLLALWRGFGEAGPIVDVYRFWLEQPGGPLTMRQCWAWGVAHLLVTTPRDLARALRHLTTGHGAWLAILRVLARFYGRLGTLLTWRGRLDRLYTEIGAAPWREPFPRADSFSDPDLQQGVSGNRPDSRP